MLIWFIYTHVLLLLTMRYIIAESLSLIRCLIFQLHQTCYRYKAQLDGQNKMIAAWLLVLTTENKT
jgi:hypothetical protein